MKGISLITFKIAGALMLLVLCFLTQIACFDVFNTNAWYLYILTAGFLIVQFVLSFILFKMGASHTFALIGTVVCLLLLAWNALMLVSLIAETEMHPETTFGLNILSVIGHVCLLLYYIFKMKQKRISRSKGTTL